MIETKQQLDAAMSDIFKQHGAFFAFSGEQYKAGAVDGVKYTNTGGGLICPVDAVADMTAALNAVVKEYEANDLKANGKQKLIWRELANYECQITYDPSDAVAALESYGITEAEVLEEWPAYMKHCRDNDLF